MAGETNQSRPSKGGRPAARSGSANRGGTEDRVGKGNRGGRPGHQNGGRGGDGGPRREGRRPQVEPEATTGVRARRLAVELIERIEDKGAFANLVVPAALDGADLPVQDRGLVTDLVYGSIRRRRALDHIVSAFVASPPDPVVTRLLRIGAYQLLETDCAPYAAVNCTVEAAPKKVRGFVNAVLRRVAREGERVPFPNLATELSYPDWIVERFVDDLGERMAVRCLRAMNDPAEVNRREDGYTQDRSSVAVVDALGLSEDDLAIDICAAPGGKASAMALHGATVIASDRRRSRVRLMIGNFRTTESNAVALVADGTALPYRQGAADVVVVDAPCSGLGVLHGRADARWTIEPEAPERLADLQVQLLMAAAQCVRPGGLLAYSVCTLTRIETIGVAERFGAANPSWTVGGPLGDPWQPMGSGGFIVPEGRDGMAAFHFRRPGGPA